MHFKLQRKHITFLGSSRKDQKLVFPSSRGTPLQADYPEKACKQIFAMIGLDNSFTFHNLRHTATSIMLNNGMSMVEVSKKYLGHASPTITAKLYAHVMPVGLEKAIGVFDKLIYMVALYSWMFKFSTPARSRTRNLLIRSPTSIFLHCI